MCDKQFFKVVNAHLKQRAFFQILEPDGRQVGSATFEGQGVRVDMVNPLNNRKHWSFGPFSSDMKLRVEITNDSGQGKFVPSTMVGPLTVS